MDFDIVMVRVKRRKITEHAGESYLKASEISHKIPCLTERDGERFIFGIYDSDTRWTVVSSDRVVSCFDEKISSFEMAGDIDIIHKFLLKTEADAVLDDGRILWMKSLRLSYAIQNVILMLQRVRERGDRVV